MIVWLTDEQQLPARERELHLEQRLQPASRRSPATASTVSAVTPRMPSAVIRTAGGIA